MSRKKSSVVLETAELEAEFKGKMLKAEYEDEEEALSPEEIEKLPVHEQWSFDSNGKKIRPHSKIPSNECEIPTCDIHEKEVGKNEIDLSLDILLEKGEKELEETTKKVLNFVEDNLKPKMKHKVCYCVMDGPDDIVLAFLPEALDNKARGKLFQIIGELGFSMEKTTTLSASELFDRQQVEEPEPEKTLFDKLED